MIEDGPAEVFVAVEADGSRWVEERHYLAALQPEGPPAMGVEEVAQIIEEHVSVERADEECDGHLVRINILRGTKSAARAIVSALSPQPVPARGEEGVG